MKKFTLLSMLIITMIFMVSHAKRLPIEDDDDLELSDLEARSFLKKQGDKYINNLDCVLCKFNLVPCCKPNLCIKKNFRPDECLELRGREKI